ncbi:MAG: fatty acid desaturase [Myxococcales bacterium]|nr:fatty acid desaturase [Myxococcales bacterium]
MEPRTGRALILATKPFERERLGRSWYELLSTLVVYGGLLAVVIVVDPLPLRLAASVAAGLTQFRIFSLYHDHNHGSLLSRSPLARRIMSALGIHILVPRAVWKQTHDFHHWNNGKLEWAAIGSYPVMTTEQYAQATAAERRRYLRARHPLTIFGGYLTVGIFGFCIQAYRRKPKQHYWGPWALVIHALTFAALAWAWGPLTALLALIVPTAVDHALASYLFYAQHNFPQTRFYGRGEWDYSDAAVHGSSYLVMGPLMRWFTANIGFHHVHHLNAKIPSYRLPEAMIGVPELRHPHRTSFRLHDVLACLRLRTWDPAARRMQTADD